MAQANIIKVSGSATIKVAPDTMRIRIEVNSHFASNEAAYEQAKFNSLQVLASLKNVGLDETLAKTINFDISEDSKPIYEKGRWTGYKKNGYDLNQLFYIDLPTGNKEANAIVKYCTENVPYAEIKLDSYISEPRKHKLEAISLAVKDAKEKAEIIATSLGCALGSILEVNYGCAETRGICYEDCDYSVGAAPGGAPLAFNGQEEEIEEAVIVIWQIQNPM